MSKGIRNVCFTINEKNTGPAALRWNREDLEGWLKEWNEKDLPTEVTYLVAQLECGEEEKTYHIQGYAEFTKQLKLDKIKELFDCYHVHLAARKGTAAQAAAYCKKDDTWVNDTLRVERGKPKEQGRRTDLETMARKINDGGEEAILEIAEERPDLIVRYHKGFKELAILKNPPKERDEPTVLYFYGPPGCGKSRLAHKLYPNAYTANDKKEGWFDNYRGEKVIIFDEFEGNYPIREMLRLLD